MYITPLSCDCRIDTATMLNMKGQRLVQLVVSRTKPDVCVKTVVPRLTVCVSTL